MLDVLNIGLGPVDLIDCACNFLTMLNQFCGGRQAPCAIQVVLALADCFSGVVGCGLGSLGGIWYTIMRNPFNVWAILENMAAGCVIGDAVLDTILFALENLNDQGAVLPVAQYAACGRLFAAGGRVVKKIF